MSNAFNLSQLANNVSSAGVLAVSGGGTGTNSTTYCNLASNVTGQLPVANGGTGTNTITSNSVILGNGVSALNGNLVAPGTSGNVLTSNGTTWQSTAPTSSAPTTAQVLNAYAGASVGAVGTYGWFWSTSTGIPSQGSTIAGSNLRYAGFTQNVGGTTSYMNTNGIANLLVGNGSTPSGTWMLMGSTASWSNSSWYNMGLYLRTA